MLMRAIFFKGTRYISTNVSGTPIVFFMEKDHREQPKLHFCKAGVKDPLTLLSQRKPTEHKPSLLDFNPNRVWVDRDVKEKTDGFFHVAPTENLLQKPRRKSISQGNDDGAEEVARYSMYSDLGVDGSVLFNRADKSPTSSKLLTDNTGNTSFTVAQCFSANVSSTANATGRFQHDTSSPHVTSCIIKPKHETTWAEDEGTQYVTTFEDVFKNKPDNNNIINNRSRVDTHRVPTEAISEFPPAAGKEFCPNNTTTPWSPNTSAVSESALPLSNDYIVPSPSGENHSAHLSNRRQRRDGARFKYSKTHEPKSPTSSALTSLTQNFLGHARDLHALARSAATNLLNSAAPIRNILEESINATEGPVSHHKIDGTRLPMSLIPRDGDEAFPWIGTSDALDTTIDILTSSYHRRLFPGPFDPRFPLFGKIQNAWFKIKPQLSSPIGTRLLKCNYCWLVYYCLCQTFEEQHKKRKYSWFPFLPNYYVNRCMPCNVINSMDKDISSCRKLNSSISSLQLYLGETLSAILWNVWILWENLPPIQGKLVCTSFRFMFEPDLSRNSCAITVGTQWMHLLNLWDVPLGVIDTCCRGTLGSKEKAYIVAYLKLEKLGPIKKGISKTNTEPNCNRTNFGASLLPPYAGTNDYWERPQPRQSDITTHFKLNEKRIIPESACLEISTKDHRKFRIVILEEGRECNVLFLLHNLMFPQSVASLFAFTLGRSPENIQQNELKTSDIRDVYSPIEEWSRLLLQSNADWLRISRINSNYDMCPTYPKLIIVPSMITDDALLKVATFRVKQRIPMLSWAGPKGFGTLWRCSQPKSMFQRCSEDELLLSTIAESAESARTYRHPLPLLIIDARPLINAMVNKASGAGFENTSTHYQRCRIEFANIDNIHHVRDAWKKMHLAMSSTTPNLVHIAPCLVCSIPQCLVSDKNDGAPFIDDEENVVDFFNTCPQCGESFPWTTTPSSSSSSSLDLAKNKDSNNVTPSLLALCADPVEPLWCYSNPTPPLSSIAANTFSTLQQQLSQSTWYDHIQYILRAASLAVSRLNQGEPVLVHCSDGWDRTAQITSLAMLCIDPYYRSLRGFCVLIEQEFLYAGHPFHLRCGHPGYSILSNRPNNPTALQGTSESDDSIPTHKAIGNDSFSNNLNNPSESYEEENSVKGGESFLTEGGIIDESDTPVEEHNSTPPDKKYYNNQRSNHQQSPIFIQWLDCVSQLIHQFPNAFEFNLRLLDFIAAELYSCYYGTFLMNCSKEREQAELFSKTLSLWNAILSLESTRMNLFINNKYNGLSCLEDFTTANSSTPTKVWSPPLYPNVSDVYIWESYWLRYRPNGLSSIASLLTL